MPFDYATNELYHHGIKGQKWGVRKKSYTSTGIRAALARRQNEKIDKSFKNWSEGSKNRADAISLGKKANQSRRAYESNKTDKSLKQQYKSDKKAYKKALKSNTTYRKGQVKQEVGSDLSRKYLSDAKKVQKQLNADPSNKQLQKQYSQLMSRHDVERAKARRAPQVAEKRSRKKAAMKRTMTMAVKGAATTALVAGGTYAANKYLSNHNVTLNGESVRFSTQSVSNVAGMAKKAAKILGYF